MPGHIFPKPEAGPVSLYYWDGSAWQKWLGNPLTTGAQLYYWDGAAWAKWQGNPTSIGSQGYVWDGSSWQKMSGDASGHVQVDVLSQPSPTTVQQTTPASLTPGICAWDGYNWRKVKGSTTGVVHTRVAKEAPLPSFFSVAGLWASGANYVYSLHLSAMSPGNTALLLKDGTTAAGIDMFHTDVAYGHPLFCAFSPPLYFQTGIFSLTGGVVFKVTLIGE